VAAATAMHRGVVVQKSYAQAIPLRMLYRARIRKSKSLGLRTVVSKPALQKLILVLILYTVWEPQQLQQGSHPQADCS